MSPPNEVFSTFSFLGFVMCAIPFYWHLEGTRRYFRHWSTHSDDIRHSLEYGHLLVYVLDWPWMPGKFHQLDCVEQEHGS
jgi:hypothetical protein